MAGAWLEKNVDAQFYVQIYCSWPYRPSIRLRWILFGSGLTQTLPMIYYILFHFIVTMHAMCISGPTKETVGDFWRMLWQLNANRIIMLTNLVEAGKVLLLHQGSTRCILYCNILYWTVDHDGTLWTCLCPVQYVSDSNLFSCVKLRPWTSQWDLTLYLLYMDCVTHK